MDAEGDENFGSVIWNLTSEPIKKKSGLKRLSKDNDVPTNRKFLQGGSSVQDVKAKSQEIKAKSQEVKAKSQEIKAKSQEVKAKSQEVKAKSQEIKAKGQEISSSSSLFKEENSGDRVKIPVAKKTFLDAEAIPFQNKSGTAKKRKFQSSDGKLSISDRSPKKARSEVHISSLFKSNPEIPIVKISHVRPKEEPLFSETAFSDLKLHPHLVSCLQNRLNISKLTEVQLKTIPVLLQKRDALVKSCTGSGKTIAYAVPIVQHLQEITPKIQRSNGIYALVIVPTRELALQSFECFSTLTKAFTRIVPGYLIGGEKKKSEKSRIRKGINILISTPGRLLDHLEHTANLDLKFINWLVIDEADKLLEQGFEEAVLKILSHTSSGSLQKPQSVLLSATLSKGVENLAGISLTNPVYVDVATSEMSSGTEELVVPAQLRQYFVITPTKLRLVSLSAFLVDKCASSNLKALIFMSTQKDVDFYYAVFSQVLRNLMKLKDYECSFFKLHGSMLQKDRFDIFNSFRNMKGGILLCTDVAARGLDLPCVDWIVQFSVPTSAENYVHRVGRTARIGKEGHSLLFIIPSEAEFVKLLQDHKIRLEELEMKNLLRPLLLISDALNEGTKQPRHSKTVEEYATALQTEYESAVYSDNTVHESAKEAFLSYVQAYASYPKQLRSIVPFKMLHLGHVAKSYCLRESPSDLGCRYVHFHKQSFRMKTDSRIPKQQNSIALVSEYSSGLDQLPKITNKHGKNKYPKKRKF